MRKLILLALAAVLTAGIFTSCSGEKETADDRNHEFGSSR